VPRGEIGYWARTRFAGRGLVHEAVEALTRLGFGTLGFVRIEIRCDQRNERSAWVARAAGYPLEGVLLRQSRGVDAELRDMLLFARVAVTPAAFVAEQAGYSRLTPCILRRVCSELRCPASCTVAAMRTRRIDAGPRSSSTAVSVPASFSRDRFFSHAARVEAVISVADEVGRSSQGCSFRPGGRQIIKNCLLRLIGVERPDAVLARTG